MVRETMLCYPDFTKPFHLFLGAPGKKLGARVAQVVTDDGSNTKAPVPSTLEEMHDAPKGFHYAPMLFHSRKLNHYQIKYPTTDKELLSIVDTLLEFRTLLFGTNIIVHTDHKNLTHNNTLHTSSRVQRQRLILEEFGC